LALTVGLHSSVTIRNFKKLQYKRLKTGGYSAQAIKECIDYEVKSADNPYVLTNFCKLLSLTYYRRSEYISGLELVRVPGTRGIFG
jgi:hypothetical protein